MAPADGGSENDSYRSANSGDGPLSKRRKVAMNSVTAITEGTAGALMTLGGVYCLENKDTTKAAGDMKYPAAAVGFGMIFACMRAATQVAARRPNRRPLGATIALIGLATTGTALTAMGAATEETDISDIIRANLEDMMTNYAKGQGPQDATVDYIQTTYKCCGADNYTTYAHTNGFRHGAVPTSCCIEQEKGCGKPPQGNNTHKEGCTTQIHKIAGKMLEDLAATMAAAAFAMTAVDITMLVYWIAHL